MNHYRSSGKPLDALLLIYGFGFGPVSANNSARSRYWARQPQYDAGAGTFSFSIPTIDGVSYRVEYKDQLTDPNWSELTTFTGDGNPKSITDPGPLPPTRFYRIIVP
jgi:hypothetical protein